MADAKRLRRQEKTARSIMKSAHFVGGPRGRKAELSAAKDVASTKVKATIAENRAKKKKKKKTSGHITHNRRR